MKLSTEEAELFFELTWPLQFFVNQKLKVLPSIRTLEEYIDCSKDEKFKVRQALYENKPLIDLFVQENPQGFTQDKLSMISEWKKFIKGDFYIERFLKKQAIFISKDDQVYGVCGLNQGFDELIHPSYLPLMVTTVLLPFAGRIIYDGLFQTYNIHFGSGIRGNLKEIYMIAKQNQRVIETLEGSARSIPSKTQVLKNWEPEIQELYEKAKHLKGGVHYPPTYASAFGLVKASLDFAQVVVSDSTDLNTLYKTLKKLERELNKAYTILNREEP
ncbi:MAG: hypothetical protein HQK65_21000 [Desulfamplus sp.]|nr:hypothetical protein [Desulfamplus sp.]